VSTRDREGTVSSIYELLDPKDGFHVIEVYLDGAYSLHCQVYADGRLQHPADVYGDAVTTDQVDIARTTVEVASWADATNADRGACARLRLVLDAVARYLNTGGAWPELTAALEKVKVVARGGIVFPGYYLHDTYVTDDGHYHHDFVRMDGSSAFVWEEPAVEGFSFSGGYVAEMTPEDLQRMKDAGQPFDPGRYGEELSGPGVEAAETPLLPDRRGT
jgi:hypothetical protein